MKSAKLRNLAIDGIGPRLQESDDSVAGVGAPRLSKAQEKTDVPEGEAEPLDAPDETELRQRLPVVDPVPGRRARRFAQHPGALVEAHGVSRNPAALGELSD